MFRFLIENFRCKKCTGQTISPYIFNNFHDNIHKSFFHNFWTYFLYYSFLNINADQGISHFYKNCTGYRPFQNNFYSPHNIWYIFIKIRQNTLRCYNWNSIYFCVNCSYFNILSKLPNFPTGKLNNFFHIFSHQKYLS